ncbi:hypothetical protein Vi05172_g148 [Venturia inaequalis]|nr:hypothetical protein Vi05172_g148 [Venturia inaequalis]
MAGNDSNKPGGFKRRTFDPNRKDFNVTNGVDQQAMALRKEKLLQQQGGSSGAPANAPTGPRSMAPPSLPRPDVAKGGIKMGSYTVEPTRQKEQDSTSEEATEQRRGRSNSRHTEGVSRSSLLGAAERQATRRSNSRQSEWPAEKNRGISPPRQKTPAAASVEQQSVAESVKEQPVARSTQNKERAETESVERRLASLSKLVKSANWKSAHGEWKPSEWEMRHLCIMCMKRRKPNHYSWHKCEAACHICRQKHIAVPCPELNLTGIISYNMLGRRTTQGGYAGNMHIKDGMSVDWIPPPPQGAESVQHTGRSSHRDESVRAESEKSQSRQDGFGGSIAGSFAGFGHSRAETVSDVGSLVKPIKPIKPIMPKTRRGRASSVSEKDKLAAQLAAQGVEIVRLRNALDQATAEKRGMPSSREDDGEAARSSKQPRINQEQGQAVPSAGPVQLHFYQGSQQQVPQQQVPQQQVPQQQVPQQQFQQQQFQQQQFQQQQFQQQQFPQQQQFQQQQFSPMNGQQQQMGQGFGVRQLPLGQHENPQFHQWNPSAAPAFLDPCFLPSFLNVPPWFPQGRDLSAHPWTWTWYDITADRWHMREQVRGHGAPYL